VTIGNFDPESLNGRHVVLCEDIVDSGLTMRSLIPHILERAEPKTLEVACLLEKRSERSTGFKADYVGFSIPDKFVVVRFKENASQRSACCAAHALLQMLTQGYCLDYNEAFRDMEHICVINEAGIAQFAASDDKS